MRKRRLSPLLLAGTLACGVAGCRSARPARVEGPTLPVRELTPEALAAELGLEKVPASAVAWSNRAWSSKPGLLRGLKALLDSVQGDLSIDKVLATEVVVVTSAINQCRY